MKELFLIRHAKTHPAHHPDEDHARSLTHEGHQEAVWLGQQLARANHIPRVILASDAQRTLQTAGLVLASLGLSDQVRPMAEMYQANAEDLLAILAGREEASIMLVGHNPAIEELIEALGGRREHVRPGSCLWACFAIERWEELFGHPRAVRSEYYSPRDEL